MGMFGDAMTHAAAVVGAGAALGAFAGGTFKIARRDRRKKVERVAFYAGYLGGMIGFLVLVLDAILGALD
ncbi:MAG: hypothetical protein ACRDL6_10615 [Solirubrobacterales bacterium]